MRFLVIATAVFALSVNITAPLTALDVGEKAPSLESVTWIKGQAVNIGATITVVEFWKTTCIHCVNAIPNLTKLQKQYGAKANIIGVSEEDESQVKPFVANMGEKMEYRVGIIDKITHVAYKKDINTSPHAFLLDASGTVMWHGHPMDIEAPLAQVVAALAKAEADVVNLMSVKSADIAGTLTKIDALFAIDPTNRVAITANMAIGKSEKKPKITRDLLVRMTKIAPAVLANDLALSCAANDYFPQRNLDLAFTLIDRALKSEPDNANYIDTKARLFAAIGLLDRAIVLQKKAVSKKPDDVALTETLAYYQATKKLGSTLNAAPH